MFAVGGANLSYSDEVVGAETSRETNVHVEEGES